MIPFSGKPVLKGDPRHVLTRAEAQARTSRLCAASLAKTLRRVGRSPGCSEGNHKVAPWSPRVQNSRQSGQSTSVTGIGPSEAQGLLEKQLQEAHERIEQLSSQVTVLDELQHHTDHQDELLAQLREVIGFDRTRESEEKAMLQAHIQKLEVQLEASSAALASAAPKTDELQQRVAELQLQVAARDADVAAAKAAMEAAENARIAAKQNSDAEQQRLKALISRGSGKGFGGPQANVRGSRKGSQGQTDTSSQQDLQKAQEDLKLAREALAMRESTLAAVSRVRDELSSKVQQQESQLVKLQQTLAVLQSDSASSQLELENTLHQQLVSVQEALQAAEARRTEVEDHAAHAADIIEGLTEQVTSIAGECHSAQEACKQLQAERDHLQSIIGEIDAMRTQQGKDIEHLAANLQELRGEVQVAQALKADLNMLAEAFGHKEEELEAALTQLQDAQSHKGILTEELEHAKEAMLGLQDIIRDMQSTNGELLQRVEALEATFQLQERTARAQEAKVAEAEGCLVQALEEMMALKTELGYRNQALQELDKQVRDMTAARNAQATALQQMGSELSSVRGEAQQYAQNAESLQARIIELEQELSVLSELEGSVRASKAALAERDEQLAQLAKELASAHISLVDTHNTLADARGALEVQRREAAEAKARAEAASRDMTELQEREAVSTRQLDEALNVAAVLSQEVNLLQAELQAKEEALASLNATDTEIQSTAEQEALSAAITKMEHLQQELAVKDEHLTRVTLLSTDGEMPLDTNNSDRQQDSNLQEDDSVVGADFAALAAAQAEVERLRSELAEREASLRQLTAAAGDSRLLAAEARAAAQEEVAKELQHLRGNVASLQKQLQRATSTVTQEAQQQQHSVTETAPAAAVTHDAELPMSREQLLRLSAQLTQQESALGTAEVTLNEKSAALDAALHAQQQAEAELGEAKQCIDTLSGEITSLRSRADMLNAELGAARRKMTYDSSSSSNSSNGRNGGLPQNGSGHGGASAAATQGLAFLHAELAAEAKASMELLGKAESLLREAPPVESSAAATSASASAAARASANSAAERAADLERQLEAVQVELQLAQRQAKEAQQQQALAAQIREEPAVHPVSAPDPTIQQELAVAKDAAVSARAEAESLRHRINSLESALHVKEQQVAELTNIQQQPRDEQVKALCNQVQKLSSANSAMLRKAAQREQVLGRAQGFLAAKVAAIAPAMEATRPASQLNSSHPSTGDSNGSRTSTKTRQRLPAGTGKAGKQ